MKSEVDGDKIVFSGTSYRGKSRLLVIVFVDGTEIEVGVMIQNNHFGIS